MIEISNLSFGYRKKTVYSDISLRFEEGHIYGLLGENGVGKTTLLKLICGLLTQQHGMVSVDGNPSHDRLPDMLAQIAFLPDNLALPQNATPESFVSEMGMFYPGYNHDYFLRLMDDMHVDSREKFASMSLGMQKKALLAAMLSLGTKYILLDEPTNGLDIPSKKVFRDVILSRIQPDTCVIISTHQVKDIEQIVNHVTILTPGSAMYDEDVEPGLDVETLFNQVIGG